jgi:lysophospholipase L1-like esterase
MRGGAHQAMQGKTLRQIVHTSLGGKSVRIHISNVFGIDPLTIDDAHLAQWSADSTIIAGTDRRVVFHGQQSVTIPPGGEIVSDPVRFQIAPLSNVAVSLYLPNASGPATYHQSGFQTNYIADGDEAASLTLTDARKVRSYFYLAGVEVNDRKALGAVVTLGASITDGFASTSDANLRWPDDLARRLNNAGIKIGVLNEGISGNRLLVEGAGDSAETRFDRDVIAQTGVRWVIFADDPINDLGSTKPQPSADALIDGLKQLVQRAHDKHIKFLCSTLTPYEGANYWNASGESAREQINAFLRSPASGCDAIVDQDTATHDPEHPSRYLPAYDSGDHLHPNNAGLQAIADSVPLSALTR